MAEINAIKASVACSTFQGSLEPIWEKGKRYTSAAAGEKGGNHQSQMKHCDTIATYTPKGGGKDRETGVFSLTCTI